MSLESIKKSNSLDKILAAVKTETAPVEKQSYVDERLWKPELDKSGNGYAVIRFLPSSDNEAMPWAKLWNHAFQGPTGKWFIENSLTTLNQKDPVSEYNSSLWNSGVESDKEIARRQKRKLQYYSNIYVVADPQHPENEDNSLVFVNCSYISKSSYTISGTTLSFSSAPANSADIEISIGTNELSLNTSSGLTFPDATKVILGTSNDLQLFHDGNNSIINHVNTASNGNMLFQVSGSTIGTVSGTGLAVNGAISATGELSGTSDGGAF